MGGVLLCSEQFLQGSRLGHNEVENGSETGMMVHVKSSRLLRIKTQTQRSEKQSQGLAEEMGKVGGGGGRRGEEARSGLVLGYRS